MKKYCLCLMFLLPCFGLLSAQEKRTEINVDFRVGSCVLEPTLGDNAAQLSKIIELLKNVEKSNTLELSEITFCGSASPEGSFKINRKLAEARLSTLENYVREYVSLPESLVNRCDAFIAWERLAVLVEQSDMKHKEEALHILRNIPEFTYNKDGMLTDSRKKHLMDMQYGRTWNYMKVHFFEKVRNASAIIVTIRPKAVEVVEEATKDTVQVVVPIDTVVTVQVQVQEPEVVAQSEERKPFYMSVKTNMLYDALAVPNIGMEFYLGKNWSVAGNWMYGWWDIDKKHRYWRIYGGDLAIRKWFGKKADEKPLTGHHLGVYGQMFTYDFEWGGKGYMGGKPGGTLWDKLNYAAGVEYGYSLPIAKRLNIDFTIGAGYWGGKYYKYIPLDGHYVWQATRDRHWFGPTKAEVSLIWLLGRGNSNDRKGGMK